jgi:Zn-dependent protease with chaperone function
MDFFHAQDTARKQSKRLILLFCLAVLGIVLSVYFASVFGVHYFKIYWGSRRYVEAFHWWNAELFIYVGGGTALLIAVTAFFKWQAFRQGGGMIARAMGGRSLSPHSRDPLERRLLNIVEEMSIASGVPVPEVYVLENEEGINAFASGYTTSDAAVAVSKGCMSLLSRDELQAVVAHEFSHILNGDMRVNSRIAAALFGILALSILGSALVRSLRHVRVRGGKNNSGGIVIAIFVVGVFLWILGSIGHLLGQMIQAALCRHREFLADASAVQFTRNQLGLIGAFRKIMGLAQGAQIESVAALEFQHFFFAQAFTANLSSLFATHPPLKERIQAIDRNAECTPIVPESPEVEIADFSKIIKNKIDRDSFVRTASAAAVMSAISSQHEASSASAGDFLQTIPDSIRSATQLPASAANLMLALLLDPDPVISKQQLMELRAPFSSEIIRTLNTALATVSESEHFSLVQLSLPALRRLPQERVFALIGTCKTFILIDKQTTPFEFSLLHALQRHLYRSLKPLDTGSVIHSFSALRESIEIAYSMLALAGNKNDQTKAETAYVSVQNAFSASNLVLAFISSSGLTWERFSKAMTQLDRAAYGMKRQLIAAAIELVSVDHQITSDEMYLLQTFADAIDVPLPKI